MRISTLLLSLALSLVCSIAMGAAKHSAKESKPVSVDDMIERRTVMSDEITDLTKPLTCSLDRDCAVVEMGVKPCGGPWKHLIYSRKNKKASTLKRKIADYNKLDGKINEAQQLMSDCSMTMPPQPKCQKHVCIDTAARQERDINRKLLTPAESLSPATDH